MSKRWTWQDIAYGGFVLALLYLIALLVSEIPDSPGILLTRSYGLTGSGFKHVLDSAIGMAALLTFVAMLAYALRYLHLRKARGSSSALFPVVLGALALGLASVLVTASILVFLSLVSACLELNGWLLLLFPVMIVGFALWFAGSYVAVLIFRKCLAAIKAGWNGTYADGKTGKFFATLFSSIIAVAKPQKED